MKLGTGAEALEMRYGLFEAKLLVESKNGFKLVLKRSSH